MGAIPRRSLVWLLAMTLIVGGMPFAQVIPCEAGLPSADMAHHSGGPHTGVSHVHAQHHDGAQAGTPPHRSGGHRKLALDLCKCLNCDMCTTPGVTPPVRDVAPERRAIPVKYGRVTSDRPIAMTSVDPGIPIALM
jgi:hypothetical protein